MLSKDMSRLHELQKLGEGDPMFLDGSIDMQGDRVAFSSWPRTGNTFLRRFIEQCTGIFTGCDMKADTTIALQMLGMLGGGHTSNKNTVWITKTHCPMWNM